MSTLFQYRKTGLYFLFLFIGISPSLLAGGSSYSAGGFGLLQPSVSGRSIGMGRVAVALPSGSFINIYNPAALIGVRLFRVDAGLFYEGIVENTAQASSYSKRVNVNSVVFALPLGKHWAVAAGFNRFLTMDYAYRIEGQSLDGFGYSENLKGTGGLQEFNLTTAYRFAQNWSAGFSFRYAFGKTEREWLLEWQSTDFVNTQDRREENRHGLRGAFGVLKENPVYHVGCYIASSHGFKTDYIQKRSTGDTSRIYSQSTTMPFEIGLGGIYHFSGYIFGADVIYYRWTSAGNRGSYRNTLRIGIGAEKKPSEGLALDFRETITYRAGAYMQQLYARNGAGHYANEYFITGGMGFPFNKNQHQLDLGLEVGTRGSIATHKVRDTIIRLTLAVSTGEKWFQQRRKKS